MQDYVDFELQLRQLEDGRRYTVEVRKAPIDGTFREEVELPDHDDFRAQLKAYEDARGEAATRKIGVPEATQERGIELDIGQLGAQLHALLMPGKIRDCFNLSMQEAKNKNLGLRIVLRIDSNSPRLAVFPWECLRDDKFFSLNTKSPIVRHVEVVAAQSPVKVDLPLRILGMVGHRKDLDVEQEQRRLQNIIDKITPQGNVELVWRKGTKWELQRALSGDEKWHVFHFIGHGGFDQQAKICLLNEETGEPEDLPADQLGTLLATHATLQLAVLNSCEGGRVDAENYYSSLGAVLGQHEIPAVISMQNPITDRAAIDFSRMLYTSLLENRRSIEAAVTQARIAIQASEEWSTPVVHIRTSGGRLMELGETTLVAPAAKPRPVEDQDAKVAQSPDPKPVAPKPVKGATEDKRLLKVAEKVRHCMEERGVLITLDMESTEDAVENEWSDGSVDVKTGQSIYDTFNEQGQSLLVLGDPGVGTTATVNELQHRLMEDFDSTKSPSNRIPVRFSLVAWTDAEPLVDWMALTMGGLTNIPAPVCKTYIESGNILPLFEHFQEVDADKRVACIQAINSYKDNIADGLLVAAHNKEYRELPADSRLTLNAAVTLKPFTRQQVLRKVEQLGEAYSGLLEVLRREPNLLSDARSHRDLIQMITAYEGKSADEIGTSSGMSTEERKVARVGAFASRRIEQGLAELDGARP